jgi:hypothetical protein
MGPAPTATTASGSIRGGTPLKAIISATNERHDKAFANCQALLGKYAGSKQRARNAFQLPLRRRRDWVGLLRNQVIKPTRFQAWLAFGRDIIDTYDHPVTLGRHWRQLRPRGGFHTPNLTRDF